VFIFGALIAPWISLSVPWVVQADPIQWLALAGILLFPTILAYLGNVVVLARTQASVTATYVMLQPMIAATLGILVLGERPEAALGVTAACVLGGLYLVSMPVGARART
jgi:DME family drug/metabolite transporter